MNRYALICLLFFLLFSSFNCGIEDNNNSGEPDYISLQIDPITDVIVDTFSSDVLNADTLYYVDINNTNASDDNDGSEANPWATISHAANTVGANSKIVVKAGVYNERVTIKNSSGTASRFLVLEADGDVEMNGFVIYSEYVAIKGFKIVDTTPSIGLWNGGGLWVSAHNVYILNNKIYNFVNSTGILSSWSGGPWNHVQIDNNYIYGCNGGISVIGINWLVRNNEVERLIQGPQGGDADYMRFFGDTIVIKNNYFHGTRENEVGNSHTDIFQSFYVNNNSARNVLLEKNIAEDFYHQGVMISVDGDSHFNIIIRNNVFADATAWGVLCGGVTNMHVINNTFYNLEIHGVGFRKSALDITTPVYATGGIVKNNIFVNSGSNYWKEEGCQYDNGYNLLYPTEDPIGQTDIAGVDPLFVNPDNIIGPDSIPFTNDDGLRLQAGSPGIGQGENGGNVGAY